MKEEELKAVFSGREVRHYSTLDSTNVKAGELARAGAPSGTVVIAEEQTAGRGRLGREWHSPPGSGLWFSLLLRPEIKPEEAPLLTVAAALALGRSLESGLGLKVQHKWPNDLLYQGKKLAGILSELVTRSGKIEYAVLGIGLNVNQGSFPEELREKATSLRLILQREVVRCRLFRGFLSSFTGYYQQLLDGMTIQLVEEWKKALNLIGREVTLYSADQAYQGKVLNISRRGEIVIADSSGEVVSFWAGDVSLR